MRGETWYTLDGSYVRTRTVGEEEAMLVRVARDEGNSAELSDAEAVRLARWLLRHSLPRADWLHVAGALATTRWQAEHDRVMIDEARASDDDWRAEEREEWIAASQTTIPKPNPLPKEHTVSNDYLTMTDPPPTGEPDRPLIYGRLAQVMAEIGSIGKDQQNDFHGYAFRGIDDVMNHLHGPLSRAGVVVLPEVLDTEFEWKQDRKGNPMRVATLRTAFHFVAEDGSRVTAVGVGEANATDDKATNKAMSAAFKYVMLQVFCIPTQDMGDADRTSPDVGVAPQLSDGLWADLVAAGSRLKDGAGDGFDTIRQDLLDRCGIDHLTRGTSEGQARAMIDAIRGWLEENTEPFPVPEAVSEPERASGADDPSTLSEGGTEAEGVAVGLMTVPEDVWTRVKALKKSELVYELGHRGEPVAGTADVLRERLALVLSADVA